MFCFAGSVGGCVGLVSLGVLWLSVVGIVRLWLRSGRDVVAVFNSLAHFEILLCILSSE